MALTLGELTRQSLGNVRGTTVSVTFDASYPTGGEALTPAQLALGRVIDFHAEPADGYVFEWDATNEKLKAFYADYDAVADGALIEVADTTNLSAVSTVVKATGL